MKDFFRHIHWWMSQWTTPVIRWLIYTCVVGFLLVAFFPNLIVSLMGASFRTTLLRGNLWQLITYAFVHASFAHLFFNLFSLWMFGTRLERRWGSRAFLRFAVVVIVGSVLTHLVLTPLVGQASVFIIGISGLVYGVLFAYAYYYPDEVVYVQFLIPLQVKYFVALLGLIAFLSSVQTSGGGIAHLTHLGGLLFGYLFVRNPRWFQWLPVPDLDRHSWR
ncbi:MAG: rhomboid family intramembrane serine protease [Candidatus Sumerlaeaceae bacterium]|nr:rhomboid family intramembrane serine protease [Candidatus Sumerlaeaceae bacterium]